MLTMTGLLAAEGVPEDDEPPPPPQAASHRHETMQPNPVAALRGERHLALSRFIE